MIIKQSVVTFAITWSKNKHTIGSERALTTCWCFKNSCTLFMELIFPPEVRVKK